MVDGNRHSDRDDDRDPDTARESEPSEPTGSGRDSTPNGDTGIDGDVDSDSDPGTSTGTDTGTDGAQAPWSDGDTPVTVDDAQRREDPTAEPDCPRRRSGESDTSEAGGGGGSEVIDRGVGPVTDGGGATYERLVGLTEHLVVNRTGRVIIAFLLLTALFGVGLSNVSTESGTQQFAEGIPSEEALSRVNAEFSPRFSTDTGSTQLIQEAPNVLSKGELLRMLRAQHRLEGEPEQRVSETSSAASVIARELDPDARTLEEQIDAIEAATPKQIDRAVRANADNPGFTGTLSTDFNAQAASASATIGVVRHELPAGLSDAAAGQGGSSPLTPIQLQSVRIVETVGGDVTVFGSGILAEEFSAVIGDSLLIVTPAAVIFIIAFLVIAYRDLVDLLLGTASLGMATVWTFGFLGLAGIPFNQIMISVPPLLLAVGIDFGIHSINRYREDRVEGRGVDESMRLATRQLVVAFFIVTGTTVIGFLANLVSDLPPIRDFGLVAAAGIVFTFLIFGIFLPALKVYVDRLRGRYPIPTFSQTPLGTEGGSVGSVLRVGAVLGRRLPILVLVVALVATAGAGVYATGVDDSFSQEDFLPPEETPAYLEALPEPFAPGEYSVVATLNFLDRSFESSTDDSVTIYVTGRMTRDSALEEIHRMGDDPPGTFITEDRHASETSIVTIIRSQAERDPEFRRLVARNDRNDNGIPDDNLPEIYDALADSEAGDRADQYLAADRRSARVVYAVEASADQDAITADAMAVAEGTRQDAIATGNIVVFQAVSDLIFASALESLAIALGGTAVFLLLIYRLLEGRASLAVANLVPIVIAVAFVAASMRLLGIALNAFTATILALTIGLGIDYSVHVVHRFIDERRVADLETALNRTVVGTGGALAGSMLTTTFGIGVLVLAVLSVLGQFGVLTALSIVYSFFASMFILPSALVVWDRAVGNDPAVPIGTADEGATPDESAFVFDREEDPLVPDRQPGGEGAE
jgi:predicted RND superfamily exporter protein